VATSPPDGLPSNPGAWLTTTADRKALVQFRRESKRDEKQREALMLHDESPTRSVPSTTTGTDLLRRLGRSEQARTADDRAIECATNTGEIAYPRPAPRSPRMTGPARRAALELSAQRLAINRTPVLP